MSRAGSWKAGFLIRYSFGASDWQLDPLGRATAFSACSVIVLGTPCHMVKHVNSAATLPRFEPWLPTGQLGECLNSILRQMASGIGHLF